MFSTYKKPLISIITAICSLSSFNAFALAYVLVPDVSQISYQTAADGKIFLRNLYQFNSGALPCCYNYYFDTTTPEGKNIFALFMSASAQGKGLYLGVPDGYAAGLVTVVMPVL